MQKAFGRNEHQILLMLSDITGYGGMAKNEA
jgi:hypothetical protein